MTTSRELLGYIAISAGMALAVSCYAMLGSLFQISQGAWIQLAVIIAGVFCILVSLSIAELAALYPSAPGLRTYLRAAFGDYVSLVAVFLYLAMVALVAGVEAYVMSVIFGIVIPEVPATPLVLSLFVLVIATNLGGVEAPRTLQLIMTFSLLIGIAGVGVMALVLAGGAPPTGVSEASPVLAEVPVGFASLAAAVGTAVFLFIGFEWVTPLGRRPESYSMLVPISMPIAIVALMVAYVLFSAGMQSTLTTAAIADSPAPQIALGGTVFGEFGRYALALLSLFAVLTSFNAGLMGASRLCFALARERALPAWCGILSLRTGVPIGAVLFVGGCAVITAGFVSYSELYLGVAVMVAAIECFVYAVLICAALRLRRTQPNVTRPFRNPLPHSVQWSVACVLPALGIAALLSLPGTPLWPLVSLMLLTAIIATIAVGASRPASKHARRPGAAGSELG